MLSTDCKKLTEKIEEMEQERKKHLEVIVFLKKQFDLFRENQKQAKACRYCKFYHQHYGKIDGEYHALNCGHCGHLRIKARKPLDECEHFEVRERKE